jgi:excisionase family DNA binding protein
MPGIQDLDPDDYISIQGVAQLLRVTTRTVRTYISEGRLAAARVGDKLLRVRVGDAQALLAPVSSQHG